MLLDISTVHFAPMSYIDPQGYIDTIEDKAFEDKITNIVYGRAKNDLFQVSELYIYVYIEGTNTFLLKQCEVRVMMDFM